MPTKRQSEPPKRTISKELFKIWKANKRHFDLKNIIGEAEKYNAALEESGESEKRIPQSHLQISKALLYGFCPNDDLRDLITKYYEDRNKKEQRLVDKFNK